MNDTMNYHDAGKRYDAGRRDEDARPSTRCIASELSEFADAVAEHQYQRGFLPVVTLKDCVSYYHEEAAKLKGTVAAGFILSVRKNLDPRNENDNYVIVQGLVDGRNKPITVNGESVSRIMHARTIDDALIKALNGKESGIFRV